MLIENIKDKQNWKYINGEWWEKTKYYCTNRKTYRDKWTKYVLVNCSICGKVFLQLKCNVKKYMRKYCSPVCRGIAIKKHYSGKNHMSFKTGTYRHQGYVFVKQKEHSRANHYGYVKQAVLVMESIIGRQLNRNEIVHHKNEIRDDDRPDNLQLMTDSEHKRYHAIKNNLGGRKHA